jgi:uncharacterized membrane-anchored protein YhcB (DUF1043 family)
MGIEYYGFALFIAGLICLIAVLIRFLFADLRRQQKLLNEKESNLLKLYTSVETIMEEFADQARVTSDEIREFESSVVMRASSLTLPPDAVNEEQVLEKQPAAARPVVEDGIRIKAASSMRDRAERIIIETPKAAVKAVASNGEVFQSFFDESVTEPVAAMQPKPAAVPIKQNRNERIISLAEEGKTDAQIAAELGITQNEVKLVKDLGAARK